MHHLCRVAGRMWPAWHTRLSGSPSPAELQGTSPAAACGQRALRSPAAIPWLAEASGLLPSSVLLPGAGPHRAAWKSSPPLSRLQPVSSRAWRGGRVLGRQMGEW